MEVIPEYNVAFSPRAQEDLAYFKKSGNIPLQKKITKLIKELEEHPTYGTGQCEALKYDLSGYWSRRIDDFHRIREEQGQKSLTSIES